MIPAVAVYARRAVAQKATGMDQEARDAFSSKVASGAAAVASWGLLQATLSWEGGDDATELWLVAQVVDWLQAAENPAGVGAGAKARITLSDYLLDLDSLVYRRVSVDAISLFTYLKRFARLAKADRHWGPTT